MTVRRGDDGVIVLEGVCPVEDAEPLLQMLQAMPAAKVDWQALPPAAYRGAAACAGVGQGPDRAVRRRVGSAMAGDRNCPKTRLAAEAGRPCAQWNKSGRQPFTLF